MDSRQMKKHILAMALKRFADQSRAEQSPRYVLSLLLDSHYLDVSDASIRRYNKILEEMIENAEDKLD